MASLELERVTFSVDCDVRKWLSLINKHRHGFSAGKMLSAL